MADNLKEALKRMERIAAQICVCSHYKVNHGPRGCLYHLKCDCRTFRLAPLRVSLLEEPKEAEK